MRRLVQWAVTTPIKAKRELREQSTGEVHRIDKTAAEHAETH